MDEKLIYKLKRKEKDCSDRYVSQFTIEGGTVIKKVIQDVFSGQSMRNDRYAVTNNRNTVKKLWRKLRNPIYSREALFKESAKFEP